MLDCIGIDQRHFWISLRSLRYFMVPALTNTHVTAILFYLYLTRKRTLENGKKLFPFRQESVLMHIHLRRVLLGQALMSQ